MVHYTKNSAIAVAMCNYYKCPKMTILCAAIAAHKKWKGLFSGVSNNVLLTGAPDFTTTGCQHKEHVSLKYFARGVVKTRGREV